MDKFKILFITDRFLPAPTANTINTLNIINEMQNRGHEITCIAINQDESEPCTMYNSIKVYNIKSTKYGRLLQFKKEGRLEFKGELILKLLFYNRKIKNMLNILKFPDVDPNQSKSILKLAQRLHKKESFDCIIGVFRPFSGVSATISMKKRYPELLCGSYYLDIISGADKPSYVPTKLYKRLCYKGEIKAFGELDFILMAKGGESTYSSKIYNAVNNKIKYVDFPVFNPKNPDRKIDFDKTKINLVYAGTLNKNYRNPTYMLKSLEKVSNYIGDIVLHIYGQGDCTSIIKEFKNKCSYQIVEHGMVPHEYVLSALQQADIMINISNKTENIVPSKIFELFSTGKPILNFMSNRTDISKGYFDMYPSVCTVLEWEDIKIGVENIKKFIMEEHGKRYSIEQLQEKFIENTPGYTVNIIEEYLSTNEKKKF